MEQNSKPNVVFQLSNNDTFVQKSLIRQLNDVIESMRGITIEVVAHGYGIDLLLDGSPFRGHLADLGKRGITFLVCEDSIRREKVDRSQLLNFATVIPAGLAHIIQRQSEGWCYIKAGY